MKEFINRIFLSGNLKKQEVESDSQVPPITNTECNDESNMPVRPKLSIEFDDLIKERIAELISLNSLDVNDFRTYFDSLLTDAAKLVVESQTGSVSMLQRKLKLGYNRAGRIIDQLEQLKIVGPFLNSEPRKVHIKTLDELTKYLQDIFESFRSFYLANKSEIDTLASIDMSSHKKYFLLNEILTSSINAGLQTRNPNFPIYKRDINDFGAKEKMITEIRVFLTKYSNSFDAISEEGHVRKIEELAGLITQKHKDILYEGVLRVGISQKIINLFLKYLWCLGWAKEPFHCPFDGIIKSRLTEYDSERKLCDWTMLTTIDEYLNFVEMAKVAALKEGMSIPLWELTVWNNRK